MSKILIDSINEEAKRTWNGGDISKNLPEWYEHWIKTGKKLAADYENQLFFETAEFIRSYVEETAKSLEAFIDEDTKEAHLAVIRNKGTFAGFDKTLFLKMVACDFEHEGIKISYRTSPIEWCDWWKILTCSQRQEIAKQVEMSFGREAYQK